MIVVYFIGWKINSCFQKQPSSFRHFNIKNELFIFVVLLFLLLYGKGFVLLFWFLISKVYSKLYVRYVFSGFTIIIDHILFKSLLNRF